MATSIPSWVAHVAGPIIAGTVAYFAAQITLEHRLTSIEDNITAHEREDDRATGSVDKRLDDMDVMFRNVWHAIQLNHGETLSP